MENDLATQNEPVVTMEDTIQSTLDSIKERDSTAAEDLKTAAAENGQQSAKPDRTRASDGKFAKTASEPTQVAEPNKSATAQPENAGAAVVENAAAPVTSAIAAAPSSWTAAGKAEWAKLSPVAQQEVTKRESDFHKGVEQYREAATYGQSIQRAIAPFENTIKHFNVTPEVAIQTLFKTDHTLRYGTPEQKLSTIHQIAQNFGIDLSQPAPQIDHNALRLQQQLDARDQELQQLKTSQQQRENDELNSHIEQAKQGKEHFDVVRNEMSALLQAGTAKDLNEAYEMAVWARPDLRQSLLNKQIEERRAEEARVAAQARAASASNVARRGTLPAQRAVGTMDDTIRSTLDSIRSR